ncbi:hypothetical protein [Paenibacillus lutrae]|uniref:Uncharacterized protein n=1 Tax=Paenibacillus lutrae TaxID=2078573 RepID=A0A7X3FLA7_9BACL|nr:hypothetical protein [Paenibacillus lutrae]MVP01813.1 hypothetical protein [Paenibacillus lutrae]
MQRIFPVNEQQLKPHIGHPVLVYLRDGGEIFGVFTRMKDGYLILNEDPSQYVPAANKNKNFKIAGKTVKAKLKQNASANVEEQKTSAAAGTHTGYAPLVLNQDMIFALFILS